MIRRGFGMGEAWQLYGDGAQGGMGSMHAYQIAAGVFIDTIDRALSLTADTPVRLAVESLISVTCWRLGCRVESFLAWWPLHLMKYLDENMLGEMWLLMRLRSGLRAMRTGQDIYGPCNDNAYNVNVTERRTRGPLICTGRYIYTKFVQGIALSTSVTLTKERLYCDIARITSCWVVKRLEP